MAKKNFFHSKKNPLSKWSIEMLKIPGLKLLSELTLVVLKNIGRVRAIYFKG